MSNEHRILKAAATIIGSSGRKDKSGQHLRPCPGVQLSWFITHVFPLYLGWMDDQRSPQPSTLCCYFVSIIITKFTSALLKRAAESEKELSSVTSLPYRQSWLNRKVTDDTLVGTTGSRGPASRTAIYVSDLSNEKQRLANKRRTLHCKLIQNKGFVDEE